MLFEKLLGADCYVLALNVKYPKYYVYRFLINKENYRLLIYKNKVSFISSYRLRKK